ASSYVTPARTISHFPKNRSGVPLDFGPSRGIVVVDQTRVALDLVPRPLRHAAKQTEEPSLPEEIPRMTFTLWLRKMFGPRVQGSRASRQPSRKRSVPQVECLEDRLAPALLTVTSLADSGTGTLRAAILNSVNHTNGG